MTLVSRSNLPNHNYQRLGSKVWALLDVDLSKCPGIHEKTLEFKVLGVVDH
jgi:hypothetical protein